jgi:hypothetical protein
MPAALGVAGLSALGCNGDSKNAPPPVVSDAAPAEAGPIGDAGTGGGTATDGAGGEGGGGGCTTSGSAIASAPAQWARPADCGGVGNLCSDGCGGGSECQLVGNVCVPLAGPQGFANDCPETPYCLAYGCMTYDQASCFCTGDAGAQYSSCACGPAAVAGLCAGEGASCATTACCKCQGLQCVTDTVSGTVCRSPCTKNEDCTSTGCCDTTAGFCHDALYCNCVDAGASCGGSGPACCPGATCLSFNEDGGGPYACYPDCTKQSDCATGTCSQTIPGLTHGACGP